MPLPAASGSPRPNDSVTRRDLGQLMDATAAASMCRIVGRYLIKMTMPYHDQNESADGIAYDVDHIRSQGRGLDSVVWIHRSKAMGPLGPPT